MIYTIYSVWVSIQLGMSSKSSAWYLAEEMLQDDVQYPLVICYIAIEHGHL